MLSFLSSLFGDDTASTTNLDAALINKAIDRAVEATDSRFRFLPNYRKRLHEPVIKAAEYIIAVVDKLPPAVALNKQAFSSDPRIRALFTTAQDIPRIMGESPFISDYLEQSTGPRPGQLYGLLSMVRDERTMFGMGLENERVVKDKMQVSVSFSNHRFAGISANEADTRWEIARRGFDFLLQMALTRIANTRESRDKLGVNRKLLRHKLETMRKGNWGLESMLDGEESQASTSIKTLEAELEDIEKALQQLGPQEELLEHGLETLCNVLEDVDSWLGIREVKLHLDYRGVKIIDPVAGKIPAQTYSELYSEAAGLQRICLLGYFPHNELPERPDLLQQAKHYLMQ